MYRGGFSSFTKTGRNIDLGRRLGESMARSHNNSSRREESKTYYEYTITDTKIEILEGISTDKSNLVLMVAADNETNKYKGTPEIWISKHILEDAWAQQTIIRTITDALPKHLQGNVWLVNGNQVLVTEDYDGYILLALLIIVVIYIVF
jgi:hypothetical protein